MPILTDAPQSGHITFEALYEQFHQVIARRAKCFLARDPDLVEEVCQETWLAAWKALPRTPEPGYAWLYRIVTNMAITALRKKYHYWPNRTGSPMPLPLSLDTCYSEDGELTLGEMVEDPKHCDPAKSDRVDIEQALKTLPPRERYLLTLRAKGYKLAEIEQILGTGRRMTWLHVDRARAAFRQVYQHEGAA